MHTVKHTALCYIHKKNGGIIMFVFSVKGSKLKKIGAVALAAVFVTLGAIYYVNKDADKPVAKIGEYSMKASTPEERKAFFTQFGWEIDEEPCEIKEVVIPQEFDDVYTKYNTIQKNQGLDLEQYKGARAKLWSYKITNYQSDAEVRGNILVFDGTVIGGDVSSTALDGFMHGFEKSSEQPTTS